MKPPACPICNYNLSGLNDESRKCPECGNAIHLDPVEIRARMRKRFMFGVASFVVILLTVLTILLLIVLSIGAQLELPLPPMVFLSLLAITTLVTLVIFERIKAAQTTAKSEWDLVFVSSDDGVRVQSATDPNDVHMKINWRRLQWIHCKRFSGRPCIRLEERFGLAPRWVELDCSWEYASRTCKNLNWFRHAVCDTKR